MILIGFMGSGKTTVARILGERLDKKIIEMDEEIVESAGKSIPEIFSEEGESGFRKYEFEVLKDFSHSDAIISTGGGVVTFEDSFEIIKSTEKKVIFLNADFDLLYSRISGDIKRPLASQPTDEVKDLYNKRIAMYKDCSDIEIDTSSGLEETILKIIDFME